MSACEKCWRDAQERALHLGGFVSEHYYALLEERKNNPCTEGEQKGDSPETPAERSREGR
jgi:hypothetical protein